MAVLSFTNVASQEIMNQLESINENYRNYDSSNSGAKKAEEAEYTVDDYRRNKQWAILQLLGENHSVVELI